VGQPSDLVQGTLDLLLLKILALEAMNAWSISLRLRQISGEAASQRRFALSGAAQARAGRLDHRGVETQREQPARKISFVDATGAEAAGKSSELGLAVGRDHPDRAIERGLA
jgi:PadR family transcriptional regulator, regulatory protein PadR